MRDSVVYLITFLMFTIVNLPLLQLILPCVREGPLNGAVVVHLCVCSDREGRVRVCVLFRVCVVDVLLVGLM